MRASSNSKKWKVADLREHPMQNAVFGDVAQAELDVLVESLRKEGLRYPIEILPDGTIICGHQRVRAANVLGWTEIDVIIRSDLATAGTQAVETHLILDNYARRQLTPLGKARCIQRLLEIELGRATAKGGYAHREQLKERIAKQMNLTSRSVNRYLRVLQTPLAVQVALDRGEITLVAAGKVSLLCKASLLEIAARIASGESAEKVVGDCLTRKAPSPESEKNEVNRSFNRLTSALTREIPALVGRTSQISARRLTNSQELLKRFSALLDDLVTEHSESETGRRYGKSEALP